MNDVGVIDTFLNTFTSYIDSGFGLIKGEVAGLSSILIALDITLAGLFWAWGADEDVMRRLVRKTLAIGFFAWIIGNFNALAKIVFESFAGLGLKAGGSSISTAEFLRPGRLAEVGLTAGQPLLDAASQLTGPVALFVNAVQITVLLISWLLILIAFFILAVQLFVTLIEFKLTTLAGFVLIPFAFFGKTAFLAEKVLGNIVASGVKVMVLAVIVGIGSGLFSQFTTSYGDAQPTISQALSAVLAALALLGLGIFGPGIATGLITGAPQLGAGAAVGTGLAAGGAALAGAGAAGMALRGAGATLSGTAAAARAGASLAGGAASAYGAGAAGQSGLSGVAGGLGGVARAGAASPLRGSAAASPTSGATPTPPSSPASSGDVPDWAQRMRRSQQVAHGIQTATHAVRSGDSHGGGSSISLSESDRP
ncbi:P-type conjugative transfer protein TrbL [Xanthobacter autotrophicus DSM 597]|uniref:P-type conjugative transfer protein TrbL n=1 Tax=Xanthobacter wiegelii TaxID=3119913 RepID=UPI0037294107